MADRTRTGFAWVHGPGPRLLRLRPPSSRQGLNLGPSACRADALPAELQDVAAFVAAGCAYQDSNLGSSRCGRDALATELHARGWTVASMRHNANHAGSGPPAPWGLRGSLPQDNDDRPGESGAATEQGRPEVVEDEGVEPSTMILQGSSARRRVSPCCAPPPGLEPGAVPVTAGHATCYTSGERKPVGRQGLEPRTRRVKAGCSAQLS
jgi:hypothetical protein